jgi:hypothetical protein
MYLGSFASFRAGLAGVAITVTVAVLAALVPATAAHATTAPSVLRGNDWECDNAKPVPYMLHAGNASVVAQPGTVKFTAQHEGAHFNGVYDSLGYMASLNSGWYCNGRKVWKPVKLGKLGNPVVSAHYVTSQDFRGDTGFDIWFEPNASYNSYDAMTHAGAGSTEAMIWLSRPDWKAWATDKRAKVQIAGHTWYVVAAHVGHGAGWERVFFVPVGSHNGNVFVSNMRLDPFFSYMMKHGMLQSSDVLEALDNGGELSYGTLSLQGYLLKGLTGV